MNWIRNTLNINCFFFFTKDFISNNSTAITKLLENFDEEDKDTLDQFLKLSECEWHVFRILGKQIALRNKVKFVDFKKKKKIKS